VTNFVSKENIRTFFGTTNVKIVYVVRINGLTVHFIDYNDSNPKPYILKKPPLQQDWNCESPLISPDGNWVTFNFFSSEVAIQSYMQKLDTNSVPVQVNANGIEPHWWVNQNTKEYYIVFARTGKDNSTYVVQGDLQNSGVILGFKKDGLFTYMQKLSGSPVNVPFFMGLKVDATSPAFQIADLPYKGGLSRDGLYLCTGLERTYILKYRTKK
jgi:hypothetical protein